MAQEVQQRRDRRDLYTREGNDARDHLRTSKH